MKDIFRSLTALLGIKGGKKVFWPKEKALLAYRTVTEVEYNVTGVDSMDFNCRAGIERVYSTYGRRKRESMLLSPITNIYTFL